jgi:uncharacterized protein YggE
VKDALRKAELFAEAAGLRVVRLLALEEAGAEVPRPLMRLAAAPPRDRVAVPIEQRAGVPRRSTRPSR